MDCLINWSETNTLFKNIAADYNIDFKPEQHVEIQIEL